MDIDFTAVVTLAPVVMALVEIAKRTGLPSRWASLAALVSGVIVSLLYAATVTGDVGQSMFVGILAGITAAGVYSGGKAIVQGG